MHTRKGGGGKGGNIRSGKTCQVFEFQWNIVIQEHKPQECNIGGGRILFTEPVKIMAPMCVGCSQSGLRATAGDQCCTLPCYLCGCQETTEGLQENT
jgi:hypothetical protein